MNTEKGTLLVKSLERANVGVAVLDEWRRVAYANPAFAKQLNLGEPVQLVGTSPLDSWTHSAAEGQASLLKRRLSSDAASTLALRVGPQRATTLYLCAGIGARRLIISLPDWPLTEDVSRTPISWLDPLTELGNRLMYDNQVRRWARLERDTYFPAVILLDLDRFKQVNDTLGHAIGDELLKLVAKRMRSTIRESDMLVRLDGDEFAILQNESVQPDSAEAVGARLVELMQRPFLIEGHQINSSASVGVAIRGHGTRKAEELLKHADLALYEAKRLGRSRLCFFDPQLESRALARRNLELDLRRALGLRQFSLLYQPQKSISGNRISGFEALIRWDHPSRGRVSPVDFISLAEEIGEIHPIGEWVLKTACRQATTWDSQLSVAVNISPVQFENDDIVNVVAKALETSGLAPERLELEITESTLLGDSDEVMRRLWGIKAMGVSIAMDDFGTGYASLSYLNSFPFSKLKIDRTFLQQAEHSPRSKALMKAILSMGESLGMATVAEGVETLDQYEELSRGGCTTAQGYYIARPMAPEAIEEYLRSSRPTSLTLVK
ncbi:EAL domain-containing protein [Pistricoccus aurantiacus]|uniref:EAL domain-containing protein n=1 Tax=Pistricoccus aurantiacus TaxID=1883414 RepID=UPI0016487B62|nr:EAL domain-containing protein [Pistricoccus aurantiacus]